jgi:hypothetical protein
MRKQTFILALVIAVLAVGALAVTQYRAAAPRAGAEPSTTLRGFYEYLDGIFVGTVRQFAITRTGSTTVPSIRVDSGTYLNEMSCNTATYNPPSLLNNGTTTVDIALPGAALGDHCGDVSLTSATSTGPYLMACRITAAATGTVATVNLSGATVDNATGTLQACYRSY